MSRLFKAVVAILILATVINAIALAYVLGYGHGVSNQLWVIEQLKEELHPPEEGTRRPDFPSMNWHHPLESTLFETGIILAICLALVLYISILLKTGRLSKPKQSGTT